MQRLTKEEEEEAFDRSGVSLYMYSQAKVWSARKNQSPENKSKKRLGQSPSAPTNHIPASHSFGIFPERPGVSDRLRGMVHRSQAVTKLLIYFVSDNFAQQPNNIIIGMPWIHLNLGRAQNLGDPGNWTRTYSYLHRAYVFIIHSGSPTEYSGCLVARSRYLRTTLPNFPQHTKDSRYHRFEASGCDQLGARVGSRCLG